MKNKLLKDNLIAKWLDNRLNDHEKKQLEKSGELDDLKIVLEDIDTWKVKEFNLDKGLQDLKKRKRFVISSKTTSKRQKKVTTWLSIAASLLILITGAYVSRNFLFNESIIFNTQIAENKTIQLPGGSIVKLDALSSISYKEKDWKNNRTVLLSGQAFFDVRKGNSFKVVTNAGTINVLGTQFNVNTHNNSFEVKCYEGKVKVKVNYNNDEEILTKGKSVIAKESVLIKEKHLATFPSWINGYSKYNKVNLSKITKDLKKYYKVQILLPEKYKDLKFTGILTHKDMEKALQTLFTSMEIKYNIDKNNNRVTF